MVVIHIICHAWPALAEGSSLPQCFHPVQGLAPPRCPISKLYCISVLHLEYALCSHSTTVFIETPPISFSATCSSFATNKIKISISNCWINPNLPMLPNCNLPHTVFGGMSVLCCQYFVLKRTNKFWVESWTPVHLMDTPLSICLKSTFCMLVLYISTATVLHVTLESQNQQQMHGQTILSSFKSRLMSLLDCLSAFVLTLFWHGNLRVGLPQYMHCQSWIPFPSFQVTKYFGIVTWNGDQHQWLNLVFTFVIVWSTMWRE